MCECVGENISFEYITEKENRSEPSIERNVLLSFVVVWLIMFIIPDSNSIGCIKNSERPWKVPREGDILERS